MARKPTGRPKIEINNDSFKKLCELHCTKEEIAGFFNCTEETIDNYCIFTIIINAILDIGLTIWRFLSGFFSCEKIVRQEDLRSVLDQNELLTEYKKTLPIELVKQVESINSPVVVKTVSEEPNA